MINTVVFMGRPGSGKGKQSELLAERLGCRIFSSGKRLRDIAKQDSVVGRKVAAILGAGDLVPAWLISFIETEAFLSLNGDESIICDGIGRRESEARIFAEICEWLGRDFQVINLEVSEKTVTERINKRHAIEGRTDDDNIQTRLDKYNSETMPALNFFRSINKVIGIDGEPAPEVIADNIWQKIQ